jgi:hypothetical protein
MNINITDYDTLLLAAKQQPEPQRFLFVFLKKSLPKDSDTAEADNFHAGRGGALEAVMCVDKDLAELSNFPDLVVEAEAMEQGWQIVLVACLDGRNGVAPSADDALEPLKMMVQTVESGGDLSRYMAFDREGVPLQFG